jgi:hypothetical protein
MIWFERILRLRAALFARDGVMEIRTKCLIVFKKLQEISQG